MNPCKNAERAAAGARFLDSKRPRWEKEVNLKTLDMKNSLPGSCVLHQLYGTYNRGIDELKIKLPITVFFGFNIEDDKMPEATWAELTLAWHREVLERLNPHVSAINESPVPLLAFQEEEAFAIA